MKHILKKAVAVILVLCLTVIPFMSAAALDTGNDYPVVCVPGLNTRTIVLNPGTEEETDVFPPSGDALTNVIKGAVAQLAKLAVTRDWDAFADALIPLVNDLFGYAACNLDGTSKENVGINWEYDAPEKIREKNETTFYYDWRIDPMVISNDLGEYIDYVLEVTGSEYVVIDCHSMGGIITLAYFAQNGYDKVKAVLYDTTAIFGTSTAGMPISGEVDFEGKAICGFVNDLLAGNDYEDFLTTLMDVLYTLGVFDGVASLGDKLVEEIAARLYDECLVPMFATMPGVWSLVPLECYEAAKVNCFADTGDTYAALVERIDNYHSNVRLKRESLIADSLAVMNIGIFSRYNYYATPVISNWDVQSDSVVDTHYSSMGATCAQVKGTLPDDYVAERKANGGKYLSPDNVIDASTCLYPDYTWIIKDYSHSWGTGKLDKLRGEILHSGNQVTIDSFEEYPQFMIYSDPDDSLKPLTADNAGEDRPETLFKSLINLIRYAFEMIKKLITDSFAK